LQNEGPPNWRPFLRLSLNLGGRAVKRGGALFKGFHDGLHGLVKEHARRTLQNPIFEFEIDVKVDFATASGVFKRPAAV
jgi:hypothetical protein